MNLHDQAPRKPTHHFHRMLLTLLTCAAWSVAWIAVTLRHALKPRRETAPPAPTYGVHDWPSYWAPQHIGPRFIPLRTARSGWQVWDTHRNQWHLGKTTNGDIAEANKLTDRLNQA